MKDNKRGFPVTRMRGARRRFALPPLWVWLLALTILLLIVMRLV